MSNVAESRRRRSAAPPSRRRRTAPKRRAATTRRPSLRVRRRRALLGGTLAGLAVIALLFVFVYPTETYLSQRGQIGAAQAHLAQLQRATAEIQRQSKALQSDTAVERIAREQYGLVHPGETPYVLVPAAASTPTTTPATTSSTLAARP
jgi:cell division protein FtsB